MNKFRLVLTIVVVFIVANFTGFFIHAIWLKQDYMPIANLYRPEGQEKMAFIVLAYLAFAIGSVWAYAHGVENKPWLGQGLRFGIVLWLILSVPWFFITYAVQPIPALLLAKQIIMEAIDKIVLGLVIAALYRPPRSAVISD
ncbi:MAG TPA: hypothetical protein VFD63_20775 [Pyrinomonadaceae bacterium]|jgi:hypothetical protein|nr:hypothetical protein [Pyrinomonadaceae bacterium]